MKIKICTPYYNVIHDETISSIDSLNDSGIEFEWVKCQGTLIAEARNALVNNAKSTMKWQQITDDFTHILCLDADISFENSDLLRLLKYDLPIVSGAYDDRMHPGNYCSGWYEKVDGNMGKFLPHSSTGMVEVDWVGAGFLLIKKEVFEKMPYPWFRHEWIHYDDNGVHHQCQSGDDLSFCLQAKKYGYKIFCDCDTVVAHHINNKPKEMSMSGLNKQGQQQEVRMSILEAVMHYQKNANDSISELSSLCAQSNKIINGLKARVEELDAENKTLKSDISRYERPADAVASE